MAEAGRTSGGRLNQPPAQAGPPRAGYPGLCPDSFQRSPGMETPQLVPVLSHPHTEKLFPDVLRESFVFQFVLIAWPIASGHH